VLQHEGPFAEHMLEHHGWPAERYRAFFTDLWAAETECLDGRADLLASLPGILEQYGWTTGPEAFLQAWFDVGIVPDQAAFEVVARARAAGVTCGLATNQQPYRAAHMLEALGYRDLFDALLSGANGESGRRQPGRIGRLRGHAR
jgi:FMN phosphatase YigB (HAD superfamily)